MKCWKSSPAFSDPFKNPVISIAEMTRKCVNDTNALIEGYSSCSWLVGFRLCARSIHIAKFKQMFHTTREFAKLSLDFNISLSASIQRQNVFWSHQ